VPLSAMTKKKKEEAKEAGGEAAPVDEVRKPKRSHGDHKGKVHRYHHKPKEEDQAVRVKAAFDQLPRSRCCSFALLSLTPCLRLWGA
jgi:hypothetical protein